MNTAALTTSTSTSTSTLTQILERYEFYITRPSKFVTEQLQEFSRFLYFDDFEYAFEATAEAPYPSWRYCRAILSRIEKLRVVGCTDPAETL